MNDELKPLESEPVKETAHTEAEIQTKAKQGKQKNKSSADVSWGLIILIFAILVFIRLFVVEPFLVSGSSMEPNFYTGDYLLVDELSYKLHPPQRGDVVVLIPPNEPSSHFIKRIIGLPGETIVVKGSVVTIYNKDHPQGGPGLVLNEPYVKFQSDKDATYTLSSTQYFVMGDNRAVSFDSRSWGPLPTANITGKAILRLYPFDEIGAWPGGTAVFKQ